jgi:hypothetical protein
MNTYLAASLAEDRRRTLVAEAVTHRRARAARRLGRRARPAGDTSLGTAPAVRGRRFAFASWHAAGQL